MIKNLLWETPHIKLAYLGSGELCLIVEDTELNDFVEDFLVEEYDLLAHSASIQSGSKNGVYYNYFDTNIPVARLIAALEQLDPKEVERIFRLNN